MTDKKITLIGVKQRTDVIPPKHIFIGQYRFDRGTKILVELDDFNWLTKLAGEFPCKKCGGHGDKFDMRQMGKYVGDCHSCGGSGKEYNQC